MGEGTKTVDMTAEIELKDLKREVGVWGLALSDLRRRVAALEAEGNPEVERARFERDAARNRLDTIEAMLAAVLDVAEHHEMLRDLLVHIVDDRGGKLGYELLEWRKRHKAEGAQSGG